jgi:hypothetical protein
MAHFNEGTKECPCKYTKFQLFLKYSLFQVWVRVADNHYLGSPYRSTLTLGSRGLLQQIQVRSEVSLTSLKYFIILSFGV